MGEFDLPILVLPQLAFEEIEPRRTAFSEGFDLFTFDA
jgi:hypothetical protein